MAPGLAALGADRMSRARQKTALTAQRLKVGQRKGDPAPRHLVGNAIYRRYGASGLALPNQAHQASLDASPESHHLGAANAPRGDNDERDRASIHLANHLENSEESKAQADP